MTEYKSNVDKLIGQDITSLKDAQDIFDALYKGAKGSRADDARQVLSSCRPLRLMLDGGMSQVNIKTSFPGCESYVSKGNFTTATAAAVVSGEHSTELDERVANLATYASYKGVDIDVRQALTDWMADDGRTHGAAVDSLYGAFGSLEYLYNIARGAKFHADDPRANVTPEESGDDESGDESGDESPKVSGEELIARGVRKMRESGATDQAIADYFMTVIGGK